MPDFYNNLHLHFTFIHLADAFYLKKTFATQKKNNKKKKQLLYCTCQRSHTSGATRVSCSGTHWCLTVDSNPGLSYLSTAPSPPQSMTYYFMTSLFNALLAQYFLENVSFAPLSFITLTNINLQQTKRLYSAIPVLNNSGATQKISIPYKDFAMHHAQIFFYL